MGLVKIVDRRGINSIGGPPKGHLEVLLIGLEPAVVVARARDIVVQVQLLLPVSSMAECIRVLVTFLQELVFAVGSLDT